MGDGENKAVGGEGVATDPTNARSGSRRDRRQPSPADARRLRVLGRVASWLLRGLGASWRVRGPESPRGPFVGAIWHQGLLAAAYIWRDQGYRVMVSRSRDGDLIDAALGPLGYGASLRGSSSRGGTSASLAAVREIRRGEGIAVLLDGPKGPARRAKVGALQLSRMAGVTLIPGAIAARPAFRFRSWDRTLLPLPFARVRYAYGEALEIPKDASEEFLKSAATELGERIDALTEELYTELE